MHQKSTYPLPGLALAVAGVLVILMLTGWELHWRKQGYPTDPNNDKHIWAHHRNKAEKLTSDDVVIIGSSRVLFDFQLDVWEEVTGKRPLQLAAAGASPIPVLKDIVENSSFNGTLVIGVTPPLFFGPLDEHYMSNERITNWVNFYHKRTYADQFNYLLTRYPQNNLAFLCASEEPHYTELDLKTRLEVMFPFPPRVPGPPPFPELGTLDNDRNCRMLDKVVTDSSYSAEITGFWSFVMSPPPDMIPTPEQAAAGWQAVIGVVSGLIKQFEDRGGNVILVRCPSQDKFRFVEGMAFPREQCWNKLVETTGCESYHFEDYDFMNAYKLPEWSHLSAPDAEVFTRAVVSRMKEDGVL